MPNNANKIMLQMLETNFKDFKQKFLILPFFSLNNYFPSRNNCSMFVLELS